MGGRGGATSSTGSLLNMLAGDEAMGKGRSVRSGTSIVDSIQFNSIQINSNIHHHPNLIKGLIYEIKAGDLQELTTLPVSFTEYY